MTYYDDRASRVRDAVGLADRLNAEQLDAERAEEKAKREREEKRAADRLAAAPPEVRLAAAFDRALRAGFNVAALDKERLNVDPARSAELLQELAKEREYATWKAVAGSRPNALVRTRVAAPEVVADKGPAELADEFRKANPWSVR